MGFSLLAIGVTVSSISVFRDGSVWCECSLDLVGLLFFHWVSFMVIDCV